MQHLKKILFSVETEVLENDVFNKFEEKNLHRKLF